MKRTIKRLLAAVSAVSVLTFSGLSVSAATAEDVIGAARAAGFLEVYIQQLDNFLKTHSYTSAQYDMMLNALGNIEDIGDEVAQKYFGKTLDEMRGEAGVDKETGVPDDSWAADIADKMSNHQLMSSLKELVNAGKKMGLDVTIDKKGDKNYVMTVRDASGNIQMIAPVGKIVDRTGVEVSEENPFIGFALTSAVCGALLTAGGAGLLLLKRKNESGE